MILTNSNDKVFEISVWIPTFLVFLVFLTLKLSEVITWSWWVVFCPLLVPMGIYLSITLMVISVFFIAGVYWLVGKLFDLVKSKLFK